MRTAAGHQAQPGQTYAQYLPSTNGQSYTRTQPGIIALRPLGTLEILDGAFRAVRFNPRLMFGIPAVVLSLGAVVVSIINFFVLQSVRLPATNEYSPSLLGIPFDAFGSFLVPGTVLGLIVVAGITVLAGLSTVAVSRAVIGEHVTGAQVWARIRTRSWSLLGATALVAVLTLAAPAVLVLLTALNTTSFALWVVTMVVGIPATLCATLLVGVRTLLVVPVVVLEGLGPLAALRRGWRLTRGSFWRLTGTYATTVVLVVFAIALTIIPLLMVTSMLSELATTNLADVFSSLFFTLSALLAATIVLPYLTAIVTLLYIDVRIRTEALDLALARGREV